MNIGDARDLRGILADMDGVWFVENRVLPGAAPALARIRAKGLPLRLVTNTTTRTRAQLAAKMHAMGLEVDEREIVSPPDTAVKFLAARGIRRVRLVIADALRPVFADFEEGGRPEALVIGDIGNRWNYELMSDLFRDVLGGAEIVALHRGRYWQVEGGLALDIGAFVAGLEYATGKTATIIGKPSPEMYRAALADLGLSPGGVCMVGDDVHHDIAGAQAAGIRGVLVRTGKYRGDLVARSGVVPDLVVDSIAALAAAL